MASTHWPFTGQTIHNDLADGLSCQVQAKRFDLTTFQIHVNELHLIAVNYVLVLKQASGRNNSPQNINSVIIRSSLCLWSDVILWETQKGEFFKVFLCCSFPYSDSSATHLKSSKRIKPKKDYKVVRDTVLTHLLCRGIIFRLNINADMDFEYWMKLSEWAYFRHWIKYFLKRQFWLISQFWLVFLAIASVHLTILTFFSQN